MAARGDGGTARQKVAVQNSVGGVLAKAPSAAPGGRWVPGKSAADGPRKRKINNPHRTLIIVHRYQIYNITKHNGGFARPERKRGFQGLPNGPLVPLSENHVWPEILRALETGARSASCDPDPLASASHNVQRDMIEAGKKLYAPPPHRILAGAMEGDSDRPHRRPTSQGDPHAEGARLEESRKQESIRRRTRRRSAELRDFARDPAPAAIASQTRRGAVPSLRERKFDGESCYLRRSRLLPGSTDIAHLELRRYI